MKLRKIFLLPIGGILMGGMLGGCTSLPKAGPAEVTRFHQPAAVSRLGMGTIFVEEAPSGNPSPALAQSDQTERNDAPLSLAALAPYKAATAQGLSALGYQETAREEAQYLAQIRVDNSVSQPAQKRSPVSVGLGGSTGTYGSGLGIGVGINLGGGQREMRDTDMLVMIRDKDSGEVVWEGRATLSVSDNSSLNQPSANARAITDALFSDFPGNNGETVEVRISAPK